MLKDVLYIDDSVVDLYILKCLHYRYNCFKSCEIMGDPLTALIELQTKAQNNDKLPDIIFLDLHMPFFDGYQFLDHFEKMYPQFNQDVWVHILTSSVSPEDISRCKQYPHVRQYHLKPIEIETLLHNEDLH